MKKPTDSKKCTLKLDRQTIRALGERDLERPAGGILVVTGPNCTLNANCRG